MFNVYIVFRTNNPARVFDLIFIRRGAARRHANYLGSIGISVDMYRYNLITKSMEEVFN